MKATITLIAMNVVIYFLAENNMNYYALVPNNDNYRLVTYMFVHANFLHLIINMMSLFAVGKALEKHIGMEWFVFIYLFCGVVAALVSNSIRCYAYTVGASGAIVGLFGFLYYAIKDRYCIELIKIITFYILCSIFGVQLNHVIHISAFIIGYSISFLYQKIK